MTKEAIILGLLGGWEFWLGLPIGILGIGLINRLAGGDWRNQLLEPEKNLSKVAIFLSIGVLLPILFIATLYPFARPGGLHVHPGEEDQQWFREWWLNHAFFIGRSVFYVLAWIVMIILNVRYRHAQGLAGVSLLLTVITSSFAMIDWVGNLAGNFVSTMFGMHMTVKHGLTALTVMIIIASSRYGLNTPPNRRHDWGNLLLAFTMFHAYLAFSQFMIIWNGNLPREISFYVHRNHGVWGGVIIAILILELFLPLLLLFFKTNKRNPKFLRGIAGLSLTANWIQSVWIVIPALYEYGHGDHAHPEKKDFLIAVGTMAVTTLVIGAISLFLLGATQKGEETHVPSADDDHGHGNHHGHEAHGHGNGHREVTA